MYIYIYLPCVPYYLVLSPALHVGEGDNLEDGKLFGILKIRIFTRVLFGCGASP